MASGDGGPAHCDATLNIDRRTVDGFGQEWTAFDQQSLSQNELQDLFDQYFRILPKEELNSRATGFDLGCGSGRWARFVAPHVAKLHCIDASEQALGVARRNLRGLENCEFHLASVDSIPLEQASMDFGYCLGVLHHVPDPEAGLRACVALLRPGAPLLLYLYYNFENRSLAFRAVWKSSDLLRTLIARAPFLVRRLVTSLIAAVVYVPLARFSRAVDKRGWSVDAIPLSYYRERSFYTMRTDALDRFGTRVEKRFSRGEIKKMMENSGLEDVRFSDQPPYWCAVGRRTLSRQGDAEPD